MTRFSDQKFMDRSIERSRPAARVAVEGSDLSRLRGIADPARREAHASISGDEGFEPVSFSHPHNGRRVYGWLVAVTADGDARIEIGDGEYAIVPPQDLRRLGKRENREKIQAELKRAIGQVSMEDDGVRADMHETSSPMPLGPDDLHLLSLGYSTSFGFPTAREIGAYVQRFHPTAAIVEIDNAMPGRIGVAVRVADFDAEAEMGAAHGGEVQEVLDPADVTDGESEHEHKEAQVFGRKPPEVSPVDAARALAGMGQKDLIDKAIRVFFNNGGATVFMKNPTASVNRDSLLAMAMPTVKRADPRLWKTIAQKATESLAGQMPPQPGQPNAPTTPGQGMAQSMGQGQGMGDVLAPGHGQVPGSSPPPSMPGQGPAPAGPDALDPNHGQVPGSSPAPAMPPPTPGAPPTGAPGAAGQGPLDAVKNSPDTQKLPPQVQEQLAKQYEQALQQKAPGQPQPQGVSGPGSQNIGPETKVSSGGAKQGVRRAGLFEKKSFGTQIDTNGGSATIANEAPPGGVTQAETNRRLEEYKHLTDQGLPPAMSQIFAGMKMHRFARRGDYVVARVEWEPACMKGRTPHAIKNYVVSFVKAKCGMNKQGANFGIIGKIYVLSIDEKSGQANVQFASEFQGPAPTMTMAV